MIAPQMNKKKTILFLHGFGYNSIQFSESIDQVLKTLKNKFPEHQMIIPDAPHILNSLDVN